MAAHVCTRETLQPLPTRNDYQCAICQRIYAYGSWCTEHTLTPMITLDAFQCLRCAAIFRPVTGAAPLPVALEAAREKIAASS